MKRVFLVLGVAGLLFSSCGERHRETPGDEYGAPRTVDPGVPAGEDTVIYEHEHGVDTVTDPSFGERGEQENPGMENGQQEMEGQQESPGMEEPQQPNGAEGNDGNAGQQQDQQIEQQQGAAVEDDQPEVVMGDPEHEPVTEEGHAGLGAVGTEGATREPGRVQRRHGFGRTGATGPRPERLEPTTTPGAPEEPEFPRDRTGAADPETEGPGPDADAGPRGED
ncbi:hypothetical protein RCC89_17855 [Cytophagaceae bacterium ABcell3]|nr:hypothetical protein RCC89_17855 [Cytophagaceae bacterium ABcell3]